MTCGKLVVMESVEADTVSEVLQAQAREQRRLASKPNIDHLDDAVVEKDDKPTCKLTKGQLITIERYASVLANKPWLDTRTYMINSVNQETGELRLWDEELEHHASSNFITGRELGYRFKVTASKRTFVPKVEPEASTTASSETPAKPAVSNEGKERRVYSTKGVIHTRVKGVAFVPKGATKATDGMRLVTTMVGTNLKVKHVDGWEETWSPNKDV